MPRYHNIEINCNFFGLLQNISHFRYSSRHFKEHSMLFVSHMFVVRSCTHTRTSIPSYPLQRAGALWSPPPSVCTIPPSVRSLPAAASGTNAHLSGMPTCHPTTCAWGLRFQSRCRSPTRGRAAAGRRGRGRGLSSLKTRKSCFLLSSD